MSPFTLLTACHRAHDKRTHQARLARNRAAVTSAAARRDARSEFDKARDELDNVLGGRP